MNYIFRWVLNLAYACAFIVFAELRNLIMEFPKSDGFSESIDQGCAGLFLTNAISTGAALFPVAIEIALVRNIKTSKVYLFRDTVLSFVSNAAFYIMAWHQHPCQTEVIAVVDAIHRRDSATIWPRPIILA